MDVYTIPAHYKGDHWNGIASISLILEGVILDLTQAKIRMQVRRSDTSDFTVLDLTSTEGGIVIVDEPGGEFQITSRNLDIPSGSYVYDIEVITADSKVRTVLRGTWKINQDITQ